MGGGTKAVGPKACLVPLLCLMLLLTAVSVQAQSSQNYRLSTSVLDESGGAAASATRKVAVSSAGQPSPIGLSQSGNYKAFGGYLYTLEGEVHCQPPPEIVETSLADGNKGCPYTETLEVQPGTGTPPLVWSVSDGTLPAGLELNGASGEISGEPEETGTFEVTVQVIDFCGESDTQAFTLSIDPYENIKGDAKADCKINVLDVLFVINIILEYVDPTEDEIWCSDCNGPIGNCDGNGEVNVIDALKIVNIILGLDACPE